MKTRRPPSRFAACLVALTALAGSGASCAADADALPNRSAELPWGAWRASEGAAPRATVEVDRHVPAGSATRLAAPALDTPGDPSSVTVRYVRWAPASHGSTVGVSVGLASETPQAAPFAAPPAAAHVQPQLGVRWRSDWHARRRVDVAAWGAYDPSSSTPLAERRSYNARVELQFKAAKRAMGMDFSHAALGLQLSSKSQMLLRANHGGPMVYYRTQW